MRVSSLCPAETITILIEMKTIADAPLTAKFVRRNERDSPVRTVVDIVILSLANRVSVLPSMGKSRGVERGRNRKAVLALDLPKCIRCAALSPSLTCTYDYEAPRDRSSDTPSYLARTILLRPLLFTTRHPRKGTWGFACIFACGYARACAYVRAHARPF